jgi:hypothetical protein
LETLDFQGFLMVATELEPVTSLGAHLSAHRALMRAIFALLAFSRILHRPEGAFPSPCLFGFFSALWAAGFIAFVYSCDQFEIVPAFWTPILIKRHCIFPPDKLFIIANRRS